MEQGGEGTASLRALQLFKLLGVLVFVKVWVGTRQSGMGSVADNPSSLEPFWILTHRKDAGLPQKRLCRTAAVTAVWEVSILLWWEARTFLIQSPNYLFKPGIPCVMTPG